MASIRLSPDLRDEYVHLFNTCDVRPERAAEVEALMQRVLSQQARYGQAESRRGVPWYFIAAVHQMESSGRFDRHLHNGEPLTARTRQVPAGRPLKGNPPLPLGGERSRCAGDAPAFGRDRLEPGQPAVRAGALQRLRLPALTPRSAVALPVELLRPL